MASRTFEDANKYKFSINGTPMPLNPQSITLEGDAVSFSYPTMKNANAALLKIGHGELALGVTFLIGNPRVAKPEGLGSALNDSLRKIWYWGQCNPFFILENELLSRSLEGSPGSSLWALDNLNISVGKDLPSSLCSLQMQFVYFEQRPFQPEFAFRKEYLPPNKDEIISKYSLTNPTFASAGLIPSGVEISNGTEVIKLHKDLSFGDIYSRRIDDLSTVSLSDSGAFNVWLENILANKPSFPVGKKLTPEITLYRTERERKGLPPEAWPTTFTQRTTSYTTSIPGRIPPSSAIANVGNRLPQTEKKLEEFRALDYPTTKSVGNFNVPVDEPRRNYKVFATFIDLGQGYINTALGDELKELGAYPMQLGISPHGGWDSRSSLRGHPQGRAIDILQLGKLWSGPMGEASATRSDGPFTNLDPKRAMLARKCYTLLAALWEHMGDTGMGGRGKFYGNWGGFYNDKGKWGPEGDYMHFEINNPNINGIQRRRQNLIELVEGYKKGIQKGKIEVDPLEVNEEATENETAAALERTYTITEMVEEENKNWQFKQLTEMSKLSAEGWSIVKPSNDGKSVYVEKISETLSFGGRDAKGAKGPVVTGINISMKPRVASFQLSKYKHPTRQFLGGYNTNISLSLFFPEASHSDGFGTGYTIGNIMSIFEEDMNKALEDRVWRRGTGIQINNDFLNGLGLSRVVYLSKAQTANSPEGVSLVLNLQPGPKGTKEVKTAASLDSAMSFKIKILDKLTKRARKADLSGYEDKTEDFKKDLEKDLHLKAIAIKNDLLARIESKYFKDVFTGPLTEIFFESFELDKSLLVNTGDIVEKTEAGKFQILVKQIEEMQAAIDAFGMKKLRLSKTEQTAEIVKAIQDTDEQIKKFTERKASLEAQRDKMLGTGTIIGNTIKDATAVGIVDPFDVVGIDEGELVAARLAVSAANAYLEGSNDLATEVGLGTLNAYASKFGIINNTALIEPSLEALFSSGQSISFLKSMPTPYKEEIEKFNSQLSVVLKERSNYEHLCLPSNPVGGETLNPDFIWKCRKESGLSSVADNDSFMKKAEEEAVKDIRGLFDSLVRMVGGEATVLSEMDEASKATAQAIQEMIQKIHEQTGKTL